jgi:hypothetical protein
MAGAHMRRASHHKVQDDHTTWPHRGSSRPREPFGLGGNLAPPKMHTIDAVACVTRRE